MADTVQIRMHRGSYAASMETEETIPATIEAVSTYLKKNAFYLAEVKDIDINVQFYAVTFSRKWREDWLVTVCDNATAFTNGPVKRLQ